MDATFDGTFGGTRSEAASGIRWCWLRGMDAANVVAAGIPGALIVVAPGWARENMFGATQDPVTFGMLGAIWLAIGLLSIVGLRHPVPLAGIFAIQIVDKSVWLAAVALPRLVGGDRLGDVVPFSIFFGVVVACWLVGAPLAHLMGRRSIGA